MRELKVDSDTILRALTDIESVSEQERIVVVIAHLENLADMEGWDHFFMYHLEMYPVLRHALIATGNARSLDVIDRYESFLRANEVSLVGDAIEEFLFDHMEEAGITPEDWHAQFEELREERWQKVRAYLRNQGWLLKI